MKIKKSELKKLIKEEIEAVMDEGFFGDLGNKMGFNTSTTKRQIKNLQILRNNWKEAVEDARFFDQEQYDMLVNSTGMTLRGTGMDPEDIAKVVTAIGGGDGSTASDAIMAALAGTTAGRYGEGVVGELSNLVMNGVPELVQAVGEEEALRAAQRLAAKFAAMQKDIDKQAKFRGQQRDAELARMDQNRQARANAAASEKKRKDNQKYGRGDY